MKHPIKLNFQSTHMLLKEGIEKKLLQKLTNKKTRVNLQNPQPGL